MPGSFVKSRINYDTQISSVTNTDSDTISANFDQSIARLNKAKAKDIFNAIRANYPGSIISQAASADSVLTWEGEGSSKAYIKKLDGTNEHLTTPIIFDANNNATVPVYFKSEKDQQYYCAGTVAVNFADPAKEDVYSNSLVKALMDKKLDTNLLTVEDVKLAEAEEQLKATLAAKYTEADTKKDAHQYKLCQSIEKAAKKCTAHWKKPFTLTFMSPMSPEQKKLRIEALEQLQILLLQNPDKMQDARRALKEINNKIRSYASFSSRKFFWTNIIITFCSAMIGVVISEGTFGGTLLGAFIGTALTHAAWFLQNPARYALESAVSASIPKANSQVDQPRNPTYGYGQQAQMDFTQDQSAQSHFVIINSAEPTPSYTAGYGAAPMAYQQYEPYNGSYQMMMQPGFNQTPVYAQHDQYPATPTNSATIYDSRMHTLDHGTSVTPPNWTPHFGSAAVPSVFQQVPASTPAQGNFGRNSQEWGQTNPGSSVNPFVKS